MLFNSYEFIFAFLPIVFWGYFFLNAKGYYTGSKLFLVFASLFFYGWWNPAYLPLILGSMGFNYLIGSRIHKYELGKRKMLLTIGVIGNLALLGYYKYADFMIENFNMLTGAHLDLLHLMLPLAISFFTFQQIAYLVDSYRGETKEYNFLNYALFVTFFPQLIAGPIVHHKEMMPQFMDPRNGTFRYKNIALGLSVFAIGLFKKVVIADTFAVWATAGFDGGQTLTTLDAWMTSLSYTFQLYYDFSGYTDMAIGAALLFNIKLPINFNSPYKALDIQDFWRRWHITLSRFLRDYIYIPLGGNRKGRARTYANLLITFLLGGIWHGAGWTFIFWGLLHGVALVVHRFWRELGHSMPKLLAWFITFNFVNFAWVFFRAKSFDDALRVLKGMAGLNGTVWPAWLQNKLSFLHHFNLQFGSCCMDKMMIVMVIAFLFVSVWANNSNEIAQKIKPNRFYAIALGGVFAFSILFLTRVSEFLYFNF